MCTYGNSAVDIFICEMMNKKKIVSFLVGTAGGRHVYASGGRVYAIRCSVGHFRSKLLLKTNNELRLFASKS